MPLEMEDLEVYLFSLIFFHTSCQFINRSVAMPFGAPGFDKVNLNVDSLWSGGPFQSDVYLKLFSLILAKH